MIFTLLLVAVAFGGGAYVQSKFNIVPAVVAVYTNVVNAVKAVIVKVQSLFAKKS